MIFTAVKYYSLLFHQLFQVELETQLQPFPYSLSHHHIFPQVLGFISPVLPPKVRDCLSEGPHYICDLMIFSSELPVPVNFLLPKSHNLLHPVTRQIFFLKAKAIITHKLNYWEHFLCIGAWQTKSDFNASSPALPLYCFEAQEYELLPTNKQAQPNWRKNAERAPLCKETFCEVFNNTRNVVLVRVPETNWNFCYLFT